MIYTRILLGIVIVLTCILLYIIYKKRNHEDKNYLMCVKCGKKATEGSAKHPYCKKCYFKKFDSIEEYFGHIRNRH